MKWSKGKMEVKHPQRGLLPVQALALELIDEFDYVEARAARISTMPEEASKEEAWMWQLVEENPVFSKLPSWIRDDLVLKPGEWRHLPVNCHARRRLRSDFVCHLYAGPEDGFTFQKALGQASKVLEVEWCRGSSHDMLGLSVVYQALLRTALGGAMAALVSGPNCRTRSVLRHFERPGAPREKMKVREDDILMWRMLFLGEVARYRRMASHEDGVQVGGGAAC